MLYPTSTKPLALSIATILASALLHNTVNAQESQAPASTTFPEVVVTDRTSDYRAVDATSATRIAAPILDTPNSVDVVTKELLRDRLILDPQEAAQNVSSVERSGSRTGGTETYIVRGFAQDGLFMDGFRSGQLSGGSVFSFEGPTDVANLERIEVLKGPSAILYGRGEPGGTVNYITNTPVFENHFSLQQQVGSYDFYRSQLNANWEAVPGKLALGTDAAYQSTGSFIDSVEGERFFLAPSFKWQIAPDTAITFRGAYSNDTRSTALAVPYSMGHVVPGTPYDRYFGEPGFSEIHAQDFRGLLTLDHRWNESHRTVLSVNAARDESDGGNFILYNFSGPLVDPVTGDIQRAAERIDYKDDYITTRLDHTWDYTLYDGPDPTPAGKDGKSALSGWAFPTVKNQLLFSAEYERQTVDGSRILSGNSPLNPEQPHYTGYDPRPLLPGFPVTFEELSNTEGVAKSLLLLDRVSFGETVYLSFGGRYEWFTGNSAYNYPVPVFAASDNDLDNATFNPSVGLVVKPARNVSLYANYAASANSFKNIGAVTASGAALDPEEARQFEIGTKVELLGGKLLGTFALFQIDKTGVSSTDPNNPFFSINGGDQQSRGMELGITGEILPGWRVQANYAYQDARVTNDPLLVNNGHSLPGVPENSGGLFTVYEIQSGPLKGLGFGGGIFLSDRVEIDQANTGTLPSFTQTDAAIYYQRSRFRVQINVKNLFDNEIYYAGSFAQEAQRGTARTIIGSVRYEF